jgi:hypothetical protein
VTVTAVLVGLITMSSWAPGSAPVLELVAVFQSPLPPTHETVAARAEVRGQRAEVRRRAAKRNHE